MLCVVVSCSLTSSGNGNTIQGGDVKALIAVSDGTAIIPSWANTLTGADVTDRSRQWVFEADDDIMCAPAVHDSTVHVGSHDTSYYAIDIDTGGGV